MTDSALRTVDAPTVKAWLDDGEAVLIDIREADEYAREHIPNARLVPLSRFDLGGLQADKEKIAVFQCASGNRTSSAAAQILASGFREVYQLSHGIEGWKKAGLPLIFNPKAPISLMRQVQITAGALTLLGVLLAALVSPWFMVLSGFVGAGLMFAGITGLCALANLLARMPWNRRTASSARG